MPPRCGASADRLTELAQPIGLAVDTVNDEVLVANEASITVYGRTANGNVAPMRTISGASTGLLEPRRPCGGHGVNNEIVVSKHQLHHRTRDNHPSSITVYNRTDTGYIAPMRTITAEDTRLQHPGVSRWTR